MIGRIGRPSISKSYAVETWMAGSEAGHDMRV